MRAIHVSVRFVPVRGALSHGDHGKLRLLKFFIMITYFQLTYFSTEASRVVVADPIERRLSAVSEGPFCPHHVEARPSLACVTEILTDLCVIKEACQLLW